MKAFAGVAACALVAWFAPAAALLGSRPRLAPLSNLLRREKPPGKLILVRHGESLWNANKTFTGWVDVDMSAHGKREVEHAARLLLERGYLIDVVYTSLLKRAIRSSWILLRELDQSFRPVKKTWRLNERHYGALQGLSKTTLAAKLGYDVVFRWRASYETRPPPMPATHALSPVRERKYADVPRHLIPASESLKDCLERTLPVWDEISVDLQCGKTVMVVAHGNSIRGLVKNIDGLDARQIERVGIPNGPSGGLVARKETFVYAEPTRQIIGIPLVYEFARNNITGALVPLFSENRAAPLSGEFLEEKGLLRAALDRERATSPQGELVKSDSSTVLSPIEKSLRLLNAERKLMRETAAAKKAAEAAANAEPGAAAESPVHAALVAPAPMRSEATPDGRVRRRRSARPWTAKNPNPPPLLVIIRHGRTEHNKLGLFTGWLDAPLAKEGRCEATAAGELLNRHGVEIDIVYTSWLSRAIETAWLVLLPLDSQWVKIIKSWRLNERMYGSLTGLSKRMIKQRHGDAQFMKWRRSYDTRPPAASPFSPIYPGNEERYVTHVRDVRFSVIQSVIRSLATRRVRQGP